MLTEKSFETGPITIHFAEGDAMGPRMVMLHGGTGNWQRFAEFLPTLEASWHLYACDLPGHGKSGRVKSGYVYEEFVSGMTPFLERQVGVPAVIMGFSLGGAIALGLAARVPALVRALILLEPPLSFYRTSGIQAFPDIEEWCNWVQQTKLSNPTLAEVITQYKQRAPEDPDALAQSASQAIYDLDSELLTPTLDNRLFNDYQPEQLMAQVGCPTLLIYGESNLGAIVNDADAEQLKKQVPRALTIQVKDADHGIIYGPAGQMALAAVARFLDSL